MSDFGTLGLDLGGTRLKAVLLDGAGREFARRVRPSRAGDGPDGPIAAVRDAVAELTPRELRIRAIGIGCPGTVDRATGRMRGPTPHLPFDGDRSLRDELRRELGMPVHLENDANCAAVAEHERGAARGRRTSVTVAVGTGVGCGIVIDGAVWRGGRGGAGELGHLPLGDAVSACRCGVVGCAEPLMSGSGLAAGARCAGIEPADAAGAFAAAAAGDPRARALVERLYDRLAASIAIVTHVIDPDVVVLAGGVANAGDVLRAGVAAALHRYVLQSHRGVPLVLGELGEFAGALGAAALARAPEH